MKIQTYSSTIRRREMDAVLTCMVDEKIGPGELNVRLVQTAKEYFGVAGALALRSPSVALGYALKAINLEKGGKVMISALAPDWQYAALINLDYIPVVLDVDQDTALVTEEEILIGQKAGASVLLYHETAGLVPDFEMLKSMGVIVIEDISQNTGASAGDKKTGTFGSLSILGLEQNDLLTAGGGAILMAAGTREWSSLRALQDSVPETDKLPDINSALGFVQLKELNKNEETRKKMREMYLHSLMQSRHKTLLQRIPKGIEPETVVPMVYNFTVVLNSGAKDVIQYAARKEIAVQPTFCGTVYEKRSGVLQDDHIKTDGQVSNCKNAASLYLRCVNFPLYPRLGEAKAAKIAKVLGTLP